MDVLIKRARKSEAREAELEIEESVNRSHLVLRTLHQDSIGRQREFRILIPRGQVESLCREMLSRPLPSGSDPKPIETLPGQLSLLPAVTSPEEAFLEGREALGKGWTAKTGSGPESES